MCNTYKAIWIRSLAKFPAVRGVAYVHDAKLITEEEPRELVPAWEHTLRYLRKQRSQEQLEKCTSTLVIPTQLRTSSQEQLEKSRAANNGKVAPHSPLAQPEQPEKRPAVVAQPQVWL